jgi:ketosteroid isomerase-like protein
VSATAQSGDRGRADRAEAAILMAREILVQNESNENVEFIARMWAAANEGGVEAALELTDPDVEWAPHPAGGQVLSTEELLAFFNQYSDRRELLKATPYSITGHGNKVLASGSFRLHGEGGRISEFQIHWVSEFEDGRLVRARSFASEQEARRSLE